MRYSNLHTHSTFSDGKHTMEENVLSAIEKEREMLSQFSAIIVFNAFRRT